MKVTTTVTLFLTPRLVLRPFSSADAPALQQLAGQRAVADTMISIPYPYPNGEAERVIAQFADDFRAGRATHLAIVLRENRQLIGAIGLRDIDREHAQAELSLWITPACWNQGYATEAVDGMVKIGFQQLRLNRIYAYHLARNPASGRVLAKTGFQREGLLRQRVRKWGVFEDVVLLALLQQDGPARPGGINAAAGSDSGGK